MWPQRWRDSPCDTDDWTMLRFSQLCEAIAATTKKNEKIRLVADYLQTVPLEEAALGALYLCGRVFPRREERVLSIGFSLLLRAVANVAGKDPAELAPILRHHGDLGAGAEEILQNQAVQATLTLPEIATVYDALARQRGPSAKQGLLEQTLRHLSALEAKYFIKIATGELRIGLKESLVEEGIAKAFDRPLVSVQRANMLTGDIGETLRLAAAGGPDSIRIPRVSPGFRDACPSRRQSGGHCRQFSQWRAGRRQIRWDSRAGPQNRHAGGDL